MFTPTYDMENVLEALLPLRIAHVSEEYQLHDAVAKRFVEAGLSFCKEYRLGPRNRIDFLVGGIGVECKKGRPNRQQVIDQLHRYAASDEVKGLILVVHKMMELPEVINSKPCKLLSLYRLHGIAL